MVVNEDDGYLRPGNDGLAVYEDDSRISQTSGTTSGFVFPPSFESIHRFF
jgi:hypothetical protein